MTKLETETGILTTKIGTFDPNFSFAELDKLIVEYEIFYKVDYDNVKTYSFKPKEEGAFPITVYLLDGKIQFVEVSPREELGVSERESLEKLLASLGGDKDYWWGHVRIVNHPKAGYESVYVIYHERKVYT